MEVPDLSNATIYSTSKIIDILYGAYPGFIEADTRRLSAGLQKVTLKAPLQRLPSCIILSPMKDRDNTFFLDYLPHTIAISGPDGRLYANCSPAVYKWFQLLKNCWFLKDFPVKTNVVDMTAYAVNFAEISVSACTVLLNGAIKYGTGLDVEFVHRSETKPYTKQLKDIRENNKDFKIAYFDKSYTDALIMDKIEHYPKIKFGLQLLAAKKVRVIKAGQWTEICKASIVQFGSYRTLFKSASYPELMAKTYDGRSKPLLINSNGSIENSYTKALQYWMSDSGKSRLIKCTNSIARDLANLSHVTSKLRLTSKERSLACLKLLTFMECLHFYQQRLLIQEDSDIFGDIKRHRNVFDSASTLFYDFYHFKKDLLLRKNFVRRVELFNRNADMIKEIVGKLYAAYEEIHKIDIQSILRDRVLPLAEKRFNLLEKQNLRIEDVALSNGLIFNFIKGGIENFDELTNCDLQQHITDLLYTNINEITLTQIKPQKVSVISPEYEAIDERFCGPLRIKLVTGNRGASVLVQARDVSTLLAQITSKKFILFPHTNQITLETVYRGYTNICLGESKPSLWKAIEKRQYFNGIMIVGHLLKYAYENDAWGMQYKHFPTVEDVKQ